MHTSNTMQPLAARMLGSTGLRLSELGFGGAALGNLYQATPDKVAVGTLNSAVAQGVTYFDTAPFYGFGLSERRIGDRLRCLDRDSYVLSSKVGRLLKPAPDACPVGLRYGFDSPMPFEPYFDYSYDGVMRSFEQSLQRLGLNRIDILLVHDIGQMTHGDNHAGHFKVLMDGGYKALAALRADGVVGAIGLGVNESEVCMDAMQHGDFDCFLLAGRYTLLEQSSLDFLLPACEQREISLILGGVFNSGILAQGSNAQGDLYYNYEPAPPSIVKRVQALEAVCDTWQVPLGAAAVQFPLAHPSVTSVLLGLANPRQVEQALALYRATIPAAFWVELQQRELLHPLAPVPPANSA